MKITRHSLITLPPDYKPHQSFVPNFDPRSYSRFKHGCRSSIAHYAVKLATLIATLQIKKPVFLGSSAYLQTPTAATLLVDKLMEDLTQDFKKVKLTRSNIIAQDYASLTFGERYAAMKGVKISYDYDLLKKSNFAGGR